MATSENNTKVTSSNHGKTFQGIKIVNNPIPVKRNCYTKPTITLVNKGLRKTDSINCDACTDCDACFDCVSCFECDTCLDCEACVGCDAGCDICVGCDFCDICVDCDGCFDCVGCMGCEVCDGVCETCEACEACEICVDCEICNAGCDTCVVDDTPVLVTLSKFEVYRNTKSITLMWRTESELHNLGFLLFRGLEPVGPFDLVNSEIIIGAGTSNVPHDYKYVDKNVDATKTYWYLLEDIDFTGEITTRGPIVCKPFNNENQASQNNFRLSTNYPNPFNSQTSFSINAPQDGYIEVDIVDILGKSIKTLFHGAVKSGSRLYRWDGCNDRGSSAASGTYIIRARFEGGGTFVATQKISYLR